MLVKNYDLVISYIEKLPIDLSKMRTSCSVTILSLCLLCIPGLSFRAFLAFPRRRLKAFSSTVVADHEVLPPPISSASDTNEYRQLILPNGIATTLVRDVKSVKSSGALAVAAGAALDPSDRPGLAHFTEHAVFLGSSKVLFGLSVPLSLFRSCLFAKTNQEYNPRQNYAFSFRQHNFLVSNPLFKT